MCFNLFILNLCRGTVFHNRQEKWILESLQMGKFHAFMLSIPLSFWQKDNTNLTQSESLISEFKHMAVYIHVYIYIYAIH